MRRILMGFLVLATIAVASSARAATRYVDKNNASPVSPFTSWADAATNIQDAITVASAGEYVYVTNGVYSAVTINKAITVQALSTNPADTVINGGAASRCVYMSVAGPWLVGFTLTNGNAGSGNGGGVYNYGVVSNCVISGNSAQYGGGVFGVWGEGKTYNCTISSNHASAMGGGVMYGSVYNSAMLGNYSGTGGGAGGYIDAYNCLVAANSNGNNSGAGFYRGGPYVNCVIRDHSDWVFGWHEMSEGYSLINCLLYNNKGVFSGAAAAVNCTVVNNSGSVGGANGYFTNCVILGNNPNLANSVSYTIQNSCVDTNGITGLTITGTGNITNNPSFVSTNAGNYRLTSGSLCINAGMNMAWMTGALDLDGASRIREGVVDMGVYENVSPKGPVFIVQ